MAFILPAWSARKRVRYIGSDGGQMPQEDSRWHWLQAELTKKLVQGGGEEVKESEEKSERTQPRQLTPQEALERIHAARGEVDVILDLVSGVEDGQHLAIGMVVPSQKSLQTQNREKELALAAKRMQLQGAAQRLKQGAELLSWRLDQDDLYYSAATELQKHWKLKASPPGHVAPLQVDISLPFKVGGAREPPAEQLPLLRLPDGSVQLKQERQRLGTGTGGGQGLEGITRLLHREQRALLWASVKRALCEEAAKMEPPDTAHALAERMAASTASEAPGTRELAALLLELYMKAVQAPGSMGRGHTSPILKPALAWLQHRMLRQEVERTLQALAASSAAVQFSWLPVSDPVMSVTLLRMEGAHPCTLIISGEKLCLEGPLTDNSSLERPDKQTSSYLGRKPLRKEQLSKLPAMMKTC